MEVFMFRKAIVVAGATALVLASITAVPASAATKVSNGVACKKAGQTTKVSGSSYRCAKNPLVKNSKLTWLSLDCLNTANTYNKAVANLPKIKAATDETVAKLEAAIDDCKKIFKSSVAAAAAENEEDPLEGQLQEQIVAVKK